MTPPAWNEEPAPDERAEMGMDLPPEEALALLAEKIRVCVHCDLSQCRTQAVPGEGSAHARIMFVGEAPGAMEDQTGRPFVGASGRLLDAMLEDIGLRRADVFIGNVNRCRPPGNRDPLAWEVKACRPWLLAQLRVIRPRVVCPLGRFALKALMDPTCRSARCTANPSRRRASSSSPSTTPPPPCTARTCAIR